MTKIEGTIASYKQADGVNRFEVFECLNLMMAKKIPLILTPINLAELALLAQVLNAFINEVEGKNNED